MSFSVHGLAVSRGIAIGRAVLVGRVDVAHYFIDASQVEAEIDRVRRGRNAVVDELQRLLADMPKDAPHELAPLLDVHLMLLQDDDLTEGVKHWIRDRLYNAEWALTTQLEAISRQFDEMEDEYLRERKADLEQVVQRVLQRMSGTAVPIGDDARTAPAVARVKRRKSDQQRSHDHPGHTPRSGHVHRGCIQRKNSGGQFSLKAVLPGSSNPKRACC